MGNLVEGVHYIVCRECGAFQAMISTKHLRACSGFSLSKYRTAHPHAPLMSSLTSDHKAKTEEQKVAQSQKLKARFKTAEGEETRRQIAEASKRMQAGPYREQAAVHLQMLNKNPEQLMQRRQETQASWDSGELREVVEGWHRDNREESLEGAANARRYIVRKRTKPHMRFKQAMVAAGVTGFQTEHEVGYYAIDEAHPGLKIAVEVDGCYWHGCIECGYPGIGMNKSLDRRKNTYLTRRGWLMIRIKEHEVKADIGACVKKVQKAIQTLAQKSAA